MFSFAEKTAGGEQIQKYIYLSATTVLIKPAPVEIHKTNTFTSNNGKNAGNTIVFAPFWPARHELESQKQPRLYKGKAVYSPLAPQWQKPPALSCLLQESADNMHFIQQREKNSQLIEFGSVSLEKKWVSPGLTLPTPALQFIMSNHTMICSCHLRHWPVSLPELQSHQVAGRLPPTPDLYDLTLSALKLSCPHPTAWLSDHWTQSPRLHHPDWHQCLAPSSRALTLHPPDFFLQHHTCGCGYHHRPWRGPEGPLGSTPWTGPACSGPRDGGGIWHGPHQRLRLYHPWSHRLIVCHQGSKQQRVQTCHCQSDQMIGLIQDEEQWGCQSAATSRCPTIWLRRCHRQLQPEWCPKNKFLFGLVLIRGSEIIQ